MAAAAAAADEAPPAAEDAAADGDGTASATDRPGVWPSGWAL